ncbi:terminase small subunit [Dyadobacter chenhuakuii]|uniref:Terminase small subunit n=1 Tax=Dyadobacter chenhuakuii TaxID=2909339 RepID=A0A9X1TTW1_9BACT|nr:terminase small subunit [Dyadobacter chenhuakuii]MCF2498382.1 terminase small subunit [Dyadobacter chenhuakuii]
MTSQALGEILSPKQKRFADEYLIDLNGTQAAIRAGYSANSAVEQASQMLSNIKISEYIQVRKAELDQKLESKFMITRERVLEEYARLAFSDIRGFYNAEGGLKHISDLTDDQAASLAGVESYEDFSYVDDEKIPAGTTKKIKTYDKIRALEGIRKMLGYDQPDKHEHTGKNGMPLKAPITFISAAELTPEQIEKYLNGDRTDNEGF